jgi:hypothetical protein
MATSQAQRLDTKLLLGNSPARGAELKLLLKNNSSKLRSLSSSGPLQQLLLDVAHTTL